MKQLRALMAGMEAELERISGQFESHARALRADQAQRRAVMEAIEAVEALIQAGHSLDRLPVSPPNLRVDVREPAG